MDELIERVDNGERFHIDFEKRNMKVGKEYLIKDGQYDESKYRLHGSDINLGIDIELRIIEDLYHQYKYSTPSERSENKRRKYFKALPIDELSDAELVCGEPREVMQCVLEGHILCCILSGDLTWQDKWGSFFYQGKDPDFILLKKWIEK